MAGEAGSVCTSAYLVSYNSLKVLSAGLISNLIQRRIQVGLNDMDSFSPEEYGIR